MVDLSPDLTRPDSTPEPDTRNVGPLTGLRVIELGQLLAGPFVGRLLGDLGAEVIKVETPDRLDPMRDWGHERYRGKSLWWPVQTRNKKCVTLDLRTTAGQDLLVDLAAESDVLVENFRPQTMERWNLSYERLSAANPGLIMCRVSGYGQTGPYASRAGFASAAEGMSGLRYINGNEGEAPPRIGISLGDSLAGMFGAMGTLAALNQRHLDGLGQVVDVSLVESCFALMESALPEYDRLGTIRQPHGTSLKGVAPSNIFRARDGKWVIIAANQNQLFRRLCDLMGMPELADDDRFDTHIARAANQDELDEIIARWAATMDSAEIDALLNESGVVCGPIYTIADIVKDPHFQARDMLLPHVDPEFGEYLGPGIVPRLSRTPGAVRWSARWDPGSDNVEVYEGLLGKSSAELDELRTDGVI